MRHMSGVAGAVPLQPILTDECTQGNPNTPAIQHDDAPCAAPCFTLSPALCSCQTQLTVYRSFTQMPWRTPWHVVSLPAPARHPEVDQSQAPAELPLNTRQTGSRGWLGCRYQLSCLARQTHKQQWQLPTATYNTAERTQINPAQSPTLKLKSLSMRAARLHCCAVIEHTIELADQQQLAAHLQRPERQQHCDVWRQNKWYVCQGKQGCGNDQHRFAPKPVAGRTPGQGAKANGHLQTMTKAAWQLSMGILYH